ncbi:MULTISPECIES: thiamine phosphate synthase [unclassified Sphingobacterium]|uniref:thiamine phosphate synthase n=1 Tax=unclassified Sphingobacterium TaxID=2609468 RepID=UPI0020C23151|nr:MULTISPECIES: thiamine phosphate synthase [unclassified Sphingobacterium]
MKTNLSRIQYISDGRTFSDQERNIRKALDSGIKWLQLRWKFGREKELHQLAELSRKLCELYQATFIINDHLYLAKDLDADGIHLGLQDESILSARAVLGNEKIIGGTANSFQDVLQRIQEECDYIGLGPLRFTSTKQKLSPVLGFSGYQEIIQRLKNEKVQYPPIYAIGGIKEQDLTELLQAGIYGVAISSLIQNDPSATSRMNQFYTEDYVENSR